MAQLTCQDLCVGYDGKAVLQDLSFAVFSGEKDLGRTLEQLAVRRAMTELDAPAAAQPCHAS